MIEIGRVCIKTAGRDAGKRCVIIEVLEKNFVLIDGETRRRKCNTSHLEPLQEKVEIKPGAPHEEVAKALGIKITEKKTKEKNVKPVKKRKERKTTTK